MLDEIPSYFDLDNSDYPWSDFESKLGTFDWRGFYDDNDFSDILAEDFRFSEAYSLEDDLTEQTEELCQNLEELFSEWIESIDVSKATAKYSFPPGSRFITFNYTETLQLVYGIDDSRILHIHGKANKTELIFGHGVQLVDEPEQDENGDSNRSIFTDAENAAKSLLARLQKQTTQVIVNHRSFLECLVGLSEIIVMGHSLADVDQPYFRELACQNPICIWTLYIHRASESLFMLDQLWKCGVSKDRVECRSYTSTQ